jgi:hypothetical protein
MLRRLFLVLVAACGAAFAQQTDGEPHGDPPFLIEDGWTALLNGKDVSGWSGQDGKPHGWMTTKFVRWERLLGPTRLSGKEMPSGTILNGNGRVNNLVSDFKHGDVELYVEFMLSRGSNSGVYLQGRYEVQVFDSYGSWAPMKTSDGGAIYHRWIDEKGVGGSAPKINASRRPGEWQSYHIWFRAPRFDANGKKIQNAKFIRVLFNGDLVQENVEVEGPTRAHMPIAEGPSNPLMLQGDHGPVAFRNIYWRPLREIIVR